MRIADLLKSLFISFATLLMFVQSSPGQETKPPRPQTPDVITVNTALVQSDVMVFDKQGKFIDGLTREKFALKVDGQPREISFFERVQAGTANEEAQLAAARGQSPADHSTPPVPLDRRRTVLFFLDDFHLSIESLNYTRELLKWFVDREMGQNDQAALFTATGQIGFLQQLTDNKGVLLRAIDRLRPRPYKSTDTQNPPMSEYQALLIDQNDRDVLDVYVEQLLRELPLLGRARAEEEVRARATTILRIAAAATVNSLSGLKRLIDNSKSLPGRKILFLVSDGFFLDARNSDAYDRLRQTTAAAGASGVVIYSVDARGLVTGSVDAGTTTVFDPSGRIARSAGGEIGASQDALNALANDTGGRAFFNSNLLSKAVTTGLQETSLYYLLAWRPDNDEQRNPKYRRLEVNIIGRPELVVRFRRTVGDEPRNDTSKAQKPPASPTSRTDEVVAALRSAYPRAGFPIALTLNFINTAQKGDALVASVKVGPASLIFEAQAGVQTANILLSGVILDEQGKVVDTFDKRLTVHAKPGADTALSPDFYYNNYSLIRPGLYQVRVAAADEKGGATGCTWEWIEIPDLSRKQLALSTLLVGERKTEPAAAPPTAEGNETRAEPFAQVGLKVDRRFARSSSLRFMTIIYNATATGTGGAPAPTNTNSGSSPDLAVQVQVFRDNEPVITDPLHRLNTDGAADLARLPYAAELNLERLTPGRYVLQITIIDRIARTSASQRLRFEVD